MDNKVHLTRIIVILLALTFLFQITNGQSKGKLVGNLADSLSKQPLSHATIALYKAADSSLLTYQISTTTGLFEFTDIPVDVPLKVVITYIGYQVYRKDFVCLSTSPVFKMGEINLQPTSQQLQDITVSYEIPPVVIKKDTIEFNAASFKTLPNALVEDLLKKLPGFMVDKDGNLTINGKPVNRILVEGKSFFGDDPKIAMENLPADIIRKIQVYADKEQEDRNLGSNSNNIGNVINLTLRPDAKKGMFGKLYAGAGTTQRYEAGAIVNMFRDTLQVSALGFSNNLNRSSFSLADVNNIGGFSRGGASNSSVSADGGLAINGISFGGPTDGVQKTFGGGINMNNDWGKKLSANLQYFHGDIQTKLNNQSNVLQSVDDSSFTTRSDYYANKEAVINRLGGKLSWHPNRSNLVEYKPSLIFSKGASYATSATNSVGPTDSINSGIAADEVKDKKAVYNHTIYAFHQFKNGRRRLSVFQTLALNSSNNADTTVASNIFYNNHPPTSDTLDQLRTVNNVNNYLTNDINYTEPIGKRSSLYISDAVNWSHDNNEVNNFNKEPVSGKYVVFNPAYSNSLLRKAFNNTLQGSFAFWLRSVYFRAGLNWQVRNIESYYSNPTQTIHQSENEYLPFVKVWYKNMQFAYETSTDLPAASDIQIVPNNSNPLYVIYGNPELKQIRTSRFSFTDQQYSTKHRTYFSVDLSAAIIQDQIVYAQTISPEGVQSIKPFNKDGLFDISESMIFKKQLEKKADRQVNFDFVLLANYKKNYLVNNNEPTWVDNFLINPKIGMTINLEDKLEIDQYIEQTFTSSHFTNSSFQPLNNKTQSFFTDVNIRYIKNYIVQSSLTYIYNSAMTDGIPKSNARWNVSLSRMLFKNNAGQLKLAVYDVLNQGINVSRSVSYNYVKEMKTNVLNRYFLVTFIYNLRGIANSK